MKTRTRQRTEEEEILPPFLSGMDDSMDFDSLSDDELAEFLFDDEEETSRGIFNLPTVAGLSIITVGIAYLLDKIGIMPGFSGGFGNLPQVLPWLAGILIILLGFGVLSWRPKKKSRRVKKAIEVPSGKRKIVVEPPPPSSRPKSRRKLERSTDRKVAGVAGGIANYFGVDPTLVRIAFVIAMVASSGSFVAAYLLLSFVMPNPKPLSLEDRITIIRDS
jgi:phage shock protein C